ALVEPAGHHPIEKVRIQHHARCAPGQVQVIVQQSPVAIYTLAGTGNIPYRFHDHGDGPRGEQGGAQVVLAERDEAGDEVVQVGDWWQQALVMQNNAFEPAAQVTTSEQVGPDDPTEPQAQVCWPVMLQ